MPLVSSIGTFSVRPSTAKNSQGLPEASGGRQNEGMLGMAISYMRSNKFLKTDGGLKRIVWLPKSVKEQVKDVLEEAGLYDKIATEEDVKNVDELTEYMNRVGHPWVTG